jgi:GNAT superfamily N-acetyltransferase
MGSVDTPNRPTAPEPLSPDHNVAAFDFGVAALDAWLKKRARPNEAAGASRTFVIAKDNRVVGYYSLAAASIIHDQATSRARRNLPDPVLAVLVGRLALDKAWQGQGHGISLLQDAALRIVGAAETVGVRVILVHAMSEGAKTFYMRFGFRASPFEPMTLMITVQEARQMIGKRGP